LEGGAAKQRIIIKGMRMKNVVKHIITGTLMLLALWSTSCSHETDVFGISEKETALSIGFRLPTRSPETGEDYEVGETYENYIDIENNNYRIYFFTFDNKLIARFEPDGFVVTEKSDYRDYSVLGKAPAALANHKNFKMVVLANWPQYGDDTMKTGETLLSDICNADWGQFDSFSSFELKPERLIPFYGVHEYNNIEFKSGEVTLLPEPVTLLRAVAKVEMILKTDDYFDLSISEVKVRRYNKKGYCAPKDIFSQDDYDHGGEWSSDYVSGLHLVGNSNDTEEKIQNFRFVSRWVGTDGNKYEKWIAYLTEYQNIDAGDKYACIEVRLDAQTGEDEPYKVYFANYDESGKTDNKDNTKRFDINRNILYRFTITVRDNRLTVNVQEWKYTYDNEYTFD